MSNSGGGGFIDSLTRIDEQISTLIDVTRELKSQVGQAQQAPPTQDSDPRPRQFREADTFTLSSQVQPGVDEQIESFQMPYDGYINDITIDMPDGADNLVGASFRHGRQKNGEVIFPSGEETFVAFNGYGDRMDVRLPAHRNDEFRAVYASEKTVPIPITLLVHVTEAGPNGIEGVNN